MQTFLGGMVMDRMYKALWVFMLVMVVGATQAQQPSKVKVQKMSDNVFAMFVDYYNSLVVIGDKGVLLVDPANIERAKLLKQEIAKLTKLPVTDIVLSHEHYDHVGGTEAFPGAKIYAQRNAESVLKLDITGQAPKKIHKLFRLRTSIQMGDTSVKLYHYGAGDGVATAIVHLPKEAVVYSADMYEVNEITNRMWIDDSNHLGIRTILNKLVALKPKFAMTTHAESIDPKHLVLGAQFYNDLFDAVAPKLEIAMQKGFPAVAQLMQTLPNEVKLERFKDFKHYDHLPRHVDRMIFSIFHGG